MADRVHPADETVSPLPPGSTYVIQIPKDQVYRVPPPENDYHFKRLTRRKPNHNRCCCFLGVLILLVGIAAGVFYLVFRPEFPNYSIQSISINNFNLSSSSPISPEFDVTVRADNPNNNIGIYYLTGSSVSVFHEDAKLSSGALPVFLQGNNNVTVFTAVLTGTGVELTSG